MSDETIQNCYIKSTIIGPGRTSRPKNKPICIENLELGPLYNTVTSRLTSSNNNAKDIMLLDDFLDASG